MRHPVRARLCSRSHDSSSRAAPFKTPSRAAPRLAEDPARAAGGAAARITYTSELPMRRISGSLLPAFALLVLAGCDGSGTPAGPGMPSIDLDDGGGVTASATGR